MLAARAWASSPNASLTHVHLLNPAYKPGKAPFGPTSPQIPEADKAVGGQGMYEYAYKWAREKGQKCLQQDTALGLWRLLFQHHPWPLAEDWCSYVEASHKKAVVQDTWNVLLDFVHVRPLAGQACS